MMTNNTPNLDLPYLIAAQAQKHVTHNEAIRSLDAFVQLSVLDRDLTSAPSAPVDGARYIIASGASGIWTGKDSQLAAFQDNAWMYYTPKKGWLAWVEDEEKLLVWDGATWEDVASGLLNPASLVGVNATADTTNRLSVSSPATLFNHEGSDHQLKINKNAVADTASIMLQTGFSGHAELGLTGDNDLHFKVSADGSVWNEAFIVDQNSGTVSFPNTTIVGGSSSSVPNLLINGDFQINQRGFAGGALAAGGYGNDRWKADTGGADYSVAGHVVTLNSGILVQTVEPAIWGVDSLASTQLTVSLDSPSQDMTINVGSVSGTITAGSGRKSLTLTTGAGDTGNLEIKIARSAAGTVTFASVKLEMGSAATSWQPRNKLQEALLCQRYYTKSFDLDVAPANATASPSFLGYAPAGSYCDTDAIFFPVEMRAVPAIALFSPPEGTPVDGQWVTFIAATSWTTPTTTSAPSWFLTKQSLVVRQQGTITTVGTATYAAKGNYTADAEL